MMSKKPSKYISKGVIPSRAGYRNKIKVVIFLILCLFILSLPLGSSLASTSEEVHSSSAALVVGEGENLTISGPEYAVRGDIIVRESGTLKLQDTDFEIFQDAPGQFGIVLERSAALDMEDSTLRSEKEISLELNTDSELELVNSSLKIPSEITGSTSRIHASHSEIHTKKINLNMGELFTTDECMIEADSTLISSPELYLNRSVFKTPLTFHSDTDAELYGSSFEGIEVQQGSQAKVFGKVSVTVEDLIGVPIGDAEIVANRLGEEAWTYRTETDRSGRWAGFLLSEIVGSEEKSYKGNYHIQVEQGSLTEETTTSFPPAERMNPERDPEELNVDLKMVFSSVVPPTSYYDESNFDLVVDENKERKIETYPNEGIDNYIQDGNIYLAEEGQLVIGEESRVKVMQKDRRYRMELRDDSVLRMNESSSISSDRTLNVYLYDNSTLSLHGADIEVGSLFLDDTSSLIAENTDIDAEHIYIQGSGLELKDSVISSRSLEVETGEIILQGSQIHTDRNVTLHGDEFEVRDLKFDRPIFFQSETKSQITVTNITSPEINPLGDLTINRRWYLYIELINGHDRLVPFVDLEIYRQGPVERELIETRLVEDGRTEVPLESEIIGPERSRFVGNYVLEAEKEVNGHSIFSENSMVAVDGNTQTHVKFKDEFPYSITIDVEMPSRTEPGEVFQVSGKATYEGTALRVENATLEVVIELKGEDRKWNTTTDEKGRFDLEIEAPSAVKTYPINVRVRDEYMRMEAEESRSLEVSREEDDSINHFLFATTIGRFITVLIIVVLVILAYKIMTTTFQREHIPGYHSSRSTDLTERILNQK